MHRYPITIELSGHGYGFYPPDEFIPADTANNHQAAIFVAAMADCPTRLANPKPHEIEAARLHSDLGHAGSGYTRL